MARNATAARSRMSIALAAMLDGGPRARIMSAQEFVASRFNRRYGYRESHPGKPRAYYQRFNTPKRLRGNA